MPRIRVERTIAADPTSTALLLAGPTAMELWPGLRRVETAEHHVMAEADVPAWRNRPASVTVRALPPRRTPTAYVTEFNFSGPGVPATTGVLTLTHEPGAGGETATSALLRLDTSPFDGAGAVLDKIRVTRSLRGMAEGFLDNLAEAAEQRSTAA